MNAQRKLKLRAMLLERRQEVASEVARKLHDNRTESARRRAEDVADSAEDSEADMREDVELALVQMKADTLNKINQTLDRLDQGTYGYCCECGGEITEQRLRALPFAIRCKDCEETCEIAEQRQRVQARRGMLPSFMMEDPFGR